MGDLLEAVAAEGIGNGQGKEAEPYGQQDDIQHRRSSFCAFTVHMPYAPGGRRHRSIDPAWGTTL